MDDLRDLVMTFFPFEASDNFPPVVLFRPVDSPAFVTFPGAEVEALIALLPFARLAARSNFFQDGCFFTLPGAATTVREGAEPNVWLGAVEVGRGRVEREMVGRGREMVDLEVEAMG